VRSKLAGFSLIELLSLSPSSWLSRRFAIPNLLRSRMRRTKAPVASVRSINTSQVVYQSHIILLCCKANRPRRRRLAAIAPLPHTDRIHSSSS